MAVIAPNGPYEIQKTLPSASLQGSLSPPAPEIVPRWPRLAAPGRSTTSRTGRTGYRPPSEGRRGGPPLAQGLGFPVEVLK